MKELYIGQVIKTIRDEKELLQQEVADKSGKQRVYISRIENGDIQNLTLSMILRVAKGLGMSGAELVGRYEEVLKTGQKKNL